MIAKNRTQSIGASFKAYYLCRQLIKEISGLVNTIVRPGSEEDPNGFQ